MNVDWEALIDSFDESIARISLEDQQDVGNDSGDDGRDRNEPENDEAKRAKDMENLNHRLIELHSALRTLEEDCTSDVTSPSSSGTELAKANERHNSVLAPGEPIPSDTSFNRDVIIRLLDQCKRVLHLSEASKAHGLAAQLVAEIVKREKGRVLCLECDIIGGLEKALQDEVDEHGGVETTVQVCRVLGNLCYNCNEGRMKVAQSKCLEVLQKIAENHERIEHEDKGQRFPVILPGFLFNFCNENTDAVEATGKCGLLDNIVRNVLSTTTNDAIFNSSLNFLIVFAETAEGKPYLRDSKDFAKALNHVLLHSSSPEVNETALELIRSIAEDPVLTLSLAKSGLCQTLINHIEGRWKVKEFQEHKSDACDLLVLILSHDDSMNYIYQVEDGEYLKKFLEWLDSKEMQLMIAASLAIGNFACSEENCNQLANNGTSKRLIFLLSEYQDPMKHMKLLHALLGCLRNLAFAKSARKCLLSQGLVSPCLKLMENLNEGISQPVIFKLLGTLRVAIEGNSEPAREIGLNPLILESLVSWGLSEFQALKAESSRLIASIIKNCPEREVLNRIISVDALPHVTTMLHSSHVRMQNEALVSLTILATKVNPDLVHQHLHTDLVINGIKNCLNSDSCPDEVKINSLNFTRALLASKPKEFAIMLKDMELLECLKREDIMKLDSARQLSEEVFIHLSEK